MNIERTVPCENKKNTSLYYMYNEYKKVYSTYGPNLRF